MNVINVECLLMPHGGKCNEKLLNDLPKVENCSVQISKCPNGHGKIKSPLCCGQDMTCTL
mgnify:CR=1 FL=1